MLVEEGAGLELHILPYLERAVVPLEKLSDYVLNPDHPKGKDEARVFKAVLGIERKHAEALAEIIKESLSRALAVERPQDEHGRSWTTYHEIIGLNAATAVISIAWKFTTQEPETPKLVSCHIELDRQKEFATLLQAGRTTS